MALLRGRGNPNLSDVLTAGLVKSTYAPPPSARDSDTLASMPAIKVPVIKPPSTVPNTVSSVPTVKPPTTVNPNTGFPIPTVYTPTTEERTAESDAKVTATRTGRAVAF